MKKFCFSLSQSVSFPTGNNFSCTWKSFWIFWKTFKDYWIYVSYYSPIIPEISAELSKQYIAVLIKSFKFPELNLGTTSSPTRTLKILSWNLEYKEISFENVQGEANARHSIFHYSWSCIHRTVKTVAVAAPRLCPVITTFNLLLFLF